jgi:hypothetical protein
MREEANRKVMINTNEHGDLFPEVPPQRMYVPVEDVTKTGSLSTLPSLKRSRRPVELLHLITRTLSPSRAYTQSFRSLLPRFTTMRIEGESESENPNQEHKRMQHSRAQALKLLITQNQSNPRLYGFGVLGVIALEVYDFGVALVSSMCWLGGIYSPQPLK